MNLQEAINQMFMGKNIRNAKVGNVDFYFIKNCKLYGYDYKSFENEFEISLSLDEILSNDYEILE